MLRNRSRVMTGKQASLPSNPTTPSQTNSNPVPSFLASPRMFNGLLARTLSEPESAIMSPTSILDAKPFSNFVNHPVGHDQTLFSSPNKNNLSSSPEKNHTFEKADGVKLGLAIVNSLSNEKNDDAHLSNSLSNKKMVLFGSKLKVQIPTVQSGSTLSPVAADPPKSPADFGIKTRNSVLLCTPQSGFGSPLKSKISAHELAAEGISLTEMELSEDYTCVITHGPNPKTTHIFDDCVVENCCGVVKLSELGKQNSFSSADQLKGSLPVNFLESCNSCNNSLGDGKDVFMFRGEKAFCSNECRSQEMKDVENKDDDDLLI